MAHHFATRLILASIACIALSGCSEPKESQPSVTSITLNPADVAQISGQVDHLVRTQLASVKLTNASLRTAAQAFVDAPDEASRQALQTAWQNAHLAFASLRVLPLFGADAELMFEVDAWPIEPGFIDSLNGYPESGIVNDPTLTIDLATVASQHGITDPGEVSLGYHPLEYYAFERPITDFVLDLDDDDQTKQDAVTRRRQLFSLIADALTSRVETLGALATTAEGSPAEQLGSILDATRLAAQDGFQQAALIVDTDRGHAEFSQTSRETLAAQVRTMRELLAPDDALAGVLTHLLPTTAAALQETLERAENVLIQENPEEQELARLPLMMSAVNHQLEEFTNLLKYSTVVP